MTMAELKFMDGIALDPKCLNYRVIDSTPPTYTATTRRIMKLKLRAYPAMALFAILLAAPASARADAVADWNEIAVRTIFAATPARPVPVAFLDMAMVQAAVYDAVQAIDKRFKPYHVVIPGACGSPEAATAKAAHDILVNLFPAQIMSLDLTYAQYLLANGLAPNDPGVAVGATAAAGIIALRANDGR